jgi:hypothetical protein
MRRRLDSERTTPTGIATGTGAVVVVASACIAATAPVSAEAVRLGLAACSLAGFAALTLDPVAVACTGVLSFLVVDGFLVNRLGQLSWHGAADLARISALAAAALTGLAAGRGFRAVRRWWVWRQRSAWPAARRPDGAGFRDERSSRIGMEVSCG